MNLLEFLNYKNNCPFCGNILHFVFNSKKHKILNIDNDKLLVMFDVSLFPSVRFTSTYNTEKFLFNFDVKSNKLLIDNCHSKSQSLSLNNLKKIKHYLDNISKFTLFKRCRKCNNAYSYSSNYIEFNIKDAKISNIQINSESFLYQKNNKTYKVYSDLNKKETSIINLSQENILSIKENNINKLPLLLVDSFNSRINYLFPFL